MNPALVETTRLRLRRPAREDAERILDAYAGDAAVTRYLSWPTHANLEATRAFIAWSDAEWDCWPSGPLLAEDRDTGAVIGSTGLAYLTATRAATGYLVRREAWGCGYATEMLAAMVALARDAGLWRLEAICHADHEASARVLTAGGFVLEGRLARHTVFPNLAEEAPQDVLAFALILRPRVFVGRRSVNAYDAAA